MKIVIPLLILMSLWILITETVAQDTPGPPTNFKVTAGDRQLKLTWAHPSNINIADISRYRVRSRADGYAPSTRTLWPGPTSDPEAFTKNPSYTFTYYDNGTEITLQGVNLVGTWADLKKQ